ncbi:MAG: pantoate--beta-alanine ligase, partial [Proteobacteria bacterium]|nr:pantoate--beta-alanine ligase [Pseudomonadota bacterium]
VATVREADGLAMSSRNQFLNADQRRLAPLLYRTLQEVADQIRKAPAQHPKICRQALAALAATDFLPEYLELRNAADLMPPGALQGSLVLLVAARLGNARLIDNLHITLR